MAEFLTTKGTAFKLEEIIKGAISKLVLVSPFLQISHQFKERLTDASDRGVVIKLVYGKEKKLKEDQFTILSDIKNLELFYSPHLHAKCYLNETSMVITSMNFYSHSEENNREMGVLFDRNYDKNVFDAAINEIQSIIKSSEKQELRPLKLEISKERVYIKSQNHNGFCIRCRKEIKFRPDKPLCKSCQKEWDKYLNINHIENYCHNCGNDHGTKIILPQCPECFQNYIS
ncbi:MAG: phospholipase D family protein [Clostridiales bacterium]